MIKFIFIFLCFAMVSCQKKQTRNADDKLLAEAYGNKLYLSDISNKLAIKNKSGDVKSLTDKLVDNWIFEQILLEESQNSVANNIELDVLVDDYKRSLYINAFDNMYLEQNLDTTISQTELDTFISIHKDEFALPETILRYIFVKVPDSLNNDTLSSYWKTEDLPGLKYFTSNNNGLSLVNLSKWHYLSELKNILPESIYKKISLKKPNQYSGNDKGSKYYVKIVEIIKDTDEVPDSFLHDRVKHRILQQRKNILLKKKKSELYNQRITSKQIKVHSNTQN